MFNNNINAFIRQISNEIIYRYNLTDFFDMITDRAVKKFETEHKIHQQEAQNSIAWANLVMKNHYDRHHISLLLNLRNLVTLKLHHEYHISDIKNKKLFIQQVDCFSVKQQIQDLQKQVQNLQNQVNTVQNNKSILSVFTLFALESASESA